MRTRDYVPRSVPRSRTPDGSVDSNETRRTNIQAPRATVITAILQSDERKVIEMRKKSPVLYSSTVICQWSKAIRTHS